jgi:hypothetical protein
MLKKKEKKKMKEWKKTKKTRDQQRSTTINNDKKKETDRRGIGQRRNKGMAVIVGWGRCRMEGRVVWPAAGCMVVAAAVEKS